MAHRWLTEREVLGQRISGRYEFLKSTITTPSGEGRRSRLRVSPWPEVTDLVVEFVGQADNSNRNHRPYDPEHTDAWAQANYSNEGTATNVITTVFTYLMEVTRGTQRLQNWLVQSQRALSPQAGAGAVQRSRVRRADFTICSTAEGQAILVVGEIKRPGFFEQFTKGERGFGSTLPRLVGEEGGQAPDDAARRIQRHVAKGLSQMLKYLTRANLKYGIISCADVWWTVQRPTPHSLQVSPTISWSSVEQPTVFAAVLWLVHTAMRDQHIRPSPPREVEGAGEGNPEDEEYEGDGDEGGPEDDGGEGGLEEEDHDGDGEERREVPGRGGEEQRKRPRSHPARKLPDVPEAFLHLVHRPPIAQGWSGYTNLGKIDGQLAAIKLAPRGNKRAKVLLAEAMNYLKLQELWGTYVPRMLSYGTTCSGDIVFLATEFLPGVELATGQRTPEVAQKAKEALQAIHRAGILHCDINPHNFIIVDRAGTSGEACPDVYILDFGFSRPFRSQEECAEEMRELEEML